ncbi:18765_t:CDS:2, partial [Dentiscutata erythropus]
ALSIAHVIFNSDINCSILNTPNKTISNAYYIEFTITVITLVVSVLKLEL